MAQKYPQTVKKWTKEVKPVKSVKNGRKNSKYIVKKCAKNWSKNGRVKRKVVHLVYECLSSGNLPPSVCQDMKPGPPHKENQVSQKEDLDPPFLISAAKQDKGFVLGKSASRV